jgi:hypothetical protein
MVWKNVSSGIHVVLKKAHHIAPLSDEIQNPLNGSAAQTPPL